MRKLFAVIISLVMALSLAACGGSKTETTTTQTSAETTEAVETTTEEVTEEETTEAEEPVVSVMDIEYANYNFDYTDEIGAESSALKRVPDDAEIEIKATDENEASGVVIVPQVGAEASGEYYFNAIVAGDKITLTADEGAKIAKAESSAAKSDIEVASDGQTAEFTPAALTIAEDGSITDEIITVTMEDGAVYNIHTVSEMLPKLVLAGDGVSADDAGVYTFVIDQVLIRMNSDREVIYYRSLSCVGEFMVNNFTVSEVDGENVYAYTVITDTAISASGYTNGLYIVMNDDYVDLEIVTMEANDDPNHTHGKAFLDMHEFTILGDRHYVTLSYIPLEVTLPEGIEGVNGTQTAYVWAGIIQEVLDGEVIAEINTTDYPELYETAVECIDYANSTLDGTVDQCMDYVHINSMDYLFNDDGTVKKMIVSMRNQESVYMFDMATGSIEWILGGKASTFTGYEDYTSTRSDANGVEFETLTFGQHNARFTEIGEDGTYEISIFDNQSGTFPFMWDNGESGGINTLTRMLKVKVDPENSTAEVTDMIDAHELDAATGKCHTSDHCGSVNYWSDTSVLIGWGLNIPIDTGKPIIANFGWERGDHPIFTDYDEANDKIGLELTVVRSATRQAMIDAGYSTDFSLYSYRTYKNEK